MTSDELTTFGRLRKEYELCPYVMFQRLMHQWTSDRPPKASDNALAVEPRHFADKVKRSLGHYAINRHKIMTLIPSLDCNSHGPDGNRFVMKIFIYCPSNVQWSFERSLKDKTTPRNWRRNERECFELAQVPQQIRSLRGTCLNRPATATQDPPSPHRYKALGVVDDG